MAEPKIAPVEQSKMPGSSSHNDRASSEREQLKRESADQYRRLIDKINRSHDRDIEKAMRS